MATAQLPTQISATVHQDAISRVPDFFNASIDDILTELLQNSRRAGAAQVSVHRTTDHVTISDNGRGISDPSVLLAFGRSQWENNLTKSENPAGMGIYSLARRSHVTITSHPAGAQPWEVRLVSDTFMGKRTAAVIPLPPSDATGTSISFPMDENITDKLKKAALHYPLPVTLNGEELPRASFAARSAYQEETKGLLFCIYADTRRMPLLNFHGLVIQTSALPHVETLSNHWIVDADVRDCPDLRLTLPARKELVNTPFIEEMQQAAYTAIYAAMARHPEPVDLPRTVQQHARSLGFDLPDACPLLHAWTASTPDSDWDPPAPKQEPPTDALVMDCCPPAPDQIALFHIAEDTHLEGRLKAADPNLEGYSWYDSLPKVTAISIEATFDDTDIVITDLVRSGLHRQALESHRPDTINLVLHCQGPEGPFDEAFETDLAFLPDQPHYVDDRTPIVTKETQLSPSQLAWYLQKAFFEPSYESEDDSYDTQQAYFQAEAHRVARRMLQTPEEALTATISDAVHEHISHELPAGAIATVIIEKARPTISDTKVTVTVTRPHQDDPPDNQA